MRTFDELKSLIEQRGVHPEFGDAGEGWGIEQSSFELAIFLVRMQELGVSSCLEIGTGYKGGLSRFLAADMGWDVTTVDVKNYGHAFEGVHYVILPPIGEQRPVGYYSDLKVDLVFIDGNHERASVWNDFQVYLPYAQKVIAFHDIAGLRDCDGVMQEWLEINKSILPYGQSIHQVIATEKQSGIGWIEL